MTSWSRRVAKGVTSAFQCTELARYRDRDLGNDLHGVTHADVQPSTAPFEEIGVERLEVRDQLSASIRARCIEQSRIEDEQRHDGLMGRGGRGPGRIVVEAQVPPKPNERDLGRR